MQWSNRDKRVVFLVVFLIAALDQFVKYLIVSQLQEGDVLSIIPNFFNLVLAHNRGVAFGIFSDILHDGLRYLVLAVTTCIALTAVYFFARSETCASLPSKVALGMILGGAIGNVADRIRLGAVVDYLDFYYGHYHWPAFNVADSAIFIAVCILLVLPSKKVHSIL